VQAARAIAGRGPRTVLLSLGSKGAVALCDGEAQAIDATPVDLSAGQLQSTVGAGDAMVARVAVELARVDGVPIDPRQFFEMSRLAVAEAEGQIGAPNRAQDEIGTTVSAQPSAAS
jgi:fructose-1-phosphate kinase PfkB-like protein